MGSLPRIRRLTLGTNVVANLILVPGIASIVGAALAWAAAMLLDAALATIEVRRYVGISPPGSSGPVPTRHCGRFVRCSGGDSAGDVGTNNGGHVDGRRSVGGSIRCVVRSGP